MGRGSWGSAASGRARGHPQLVRRGSCPKPWRSGGLLPRRPHGLNPTHDLQFVLKCHVPGSASSARLESSEGLTPVSPGPPTGGAPAAGVWVPSLVNEDSDHTFLAGQVCGLRGLAGRWHLAQHLCVTAHEPRCYDKDKVLCSDGSAHSFPGPCGDWCSELCATRKGQHPHRH